MPRWAKITGSIVLLLVAAFFTLGWYESGRRHAEAVRVMSETAGIYSGAAAACRLDDTSMKMAYADMLDRAGIGAVERADLLRSITAGAAMGLGTMQAADAETCREAQARMVEFTSTLDDMMR